MPQALAALPALFASFAAFASTTLGSTIISIGLTALSVGVGLILNQANQPAVPKSTDGKINLKQNVPDLCRVYGRVKKGGDYLFLEEAGGVAYHIYCLAAADIATYTTRWSRT